MSGVSPCGFFKLPGTPPSLRRRHKQGGLIFSVGQIHEEMYYRVPPGLLPDISSVIYIAAVLEYLTKEVLKLGGDLAKNYGVSRITQLQLQHVMETNPELGDLVKATIEWKHLDNSDDDDDNEDDDDDGADIDSEDDSDMDSDDDEELSAASKLGSGMAAGGSADESSATDEDYVHMELDSVTDRTNCEAEECHADVAD